MAVFSKLGAPLRPLSGDLLFFRLQAIRAYAIKKERPAPAKIQLQPPENEKGFWKYERDYGKDSRYSKPVNNFKVNDNFVRFMLSAKDHPELWMVFILAGLAGILAIGNMYLCSERIEVWIDRSTTTPPWDWARIRDKYWKLPTIAYDPLGMTHSRLSTMETLQDQLIAAAVERGTRDAKGYWVVEKK